MVDKDYNKTMIDNMIKKLLNKRVTIGPSKKRQAEIIGWTNAFIDKYRPALEALAKK